MWAVMVGLVLADSSIVTLALPDVLRAFDTTVFGVSWVLTAFNLMLAVAILPASRLARRLAPAVWPAGLVVFAGASLACAVAPSIGILIAARCAQALGGAAVIAAAIELLAGTRGSHRRAARVWGTSGVVGLAVGPAAGGILTELLSWEAIFLVQLPTILAAPLALGRFSRAVEPGPAGRLNLGPEVGLGLLSAGLTGALFLLVIMLIEGWRNSPLEAAAIVSVVPVATLAAHFLTRRAGQSRLGVASGAILVAGGLAALGLLPGAAAGWTFAPQLLIGAGIALALPGLTDRALSVHDPEGRRAAGTIAARHAGIVLGILVLTPIFSAELTEQHRAAQRSGTAFLLDAPLPVKTKVDLARAIGERIEKADGRLPDLSPAFREVQPPAGRGRQYRQLETRLEEEVEKAATHAFSTSFLLAGALALLSLVPIGIAGSVVLAAAIAVSAALIGTYLALGGASYKPVEVADPCKPRPISKPQDGDVLQQVALSALDGAACELGVTREDLTLTLADRNRRNRFLREHRVSDEDLEQALRAGLLRAVDDARRVDALSDFEASIVRTAIERVPIGVVIDVLQRASGRNVLDLLGDLL